VRDLAGSGVRWLLAAGACVCWSLLQSRGDLSGDRPSQGPVCLGVQCGSAGRRAGAVRSSCSSGVRSRYKWTLYCLFGNRARKYKMQRVCAATVWAHCLSPATVYPLQPPSVRVSDRSLVQRGMAFWCWLRASAAGKLGRRGRRPPRTRRWRVAMGRAVL
jgi:hypothetical protein